MDIHEAKNLVVKAGIELVESGLIARTWGNVSCRIDESRFVITPSGRSYLSLIPDEIIIVNIADCSYIGDIKPSSEKGIHAEVYKLYPDINFVIHTHQENASVISATGLDSIKIEGHTCLGKQVICADYALPGTKSLRRNVYSALERSTGKAVIMKNHGALCFGKNYDEAFLVAFELEKACHDYILKQYFKLSGKNRFNAVEMSNFALSLHNKQEDENNLSIFENYPNSKRTENGFIMYLDDSNAGAGLCAYPLAESGKQKEEIEFTKTDFTVAEEIKMYKAIYNKIYNEHKNINHIILKTTPEMKAISNYGIELRPLLDDFAQIVGIIAKNVENNPVKITAALKKSSVVFVKNLGALCCGKTEEDAIAVSMVAQKACKAYIGASLFGKVKPINPLECLLMRYIYLKKYSKLAEREKPKA